MEARSLLTSVRPTLSVHCTRATCRRPPDVRTRAKQGGKQRAGGQEARKHQQFARLTLSGTFLCLCLCQVRTLPEQQALAKHQAVRQGPGASPSSGTTITTHTFVAGRGTGPGAEHAVATGTGEGSRPPAKATSSRAPLSFRMRAGR